MNKSLVTFSASVTHPTHTHLVSSSNIFSHCFPLLCFPFIIPVATKCFSSSFLNTWPKTVAWCLHILTMSDHVVPASRRTVSLDFSNIHKICNILLRVTYLLPLVSFVLVLKLSKPLTRTPWWGQHSTPGLFCLYGEKHNFVHCYLNKQCHAEHREIHIIIRSK